MLAHVPPHAPNLLCSLFVAVFPPLTGFAGLLRVVGLVPPMSAKATFGTPGRATQMDSEHWDRIRKLCISVLGAFARPTWTLD